jgi:hypothetical protein
MYVAQRTFKTNNGLNPQRSSCNKEVLGEMLREFGRQKYFSG